MDFFFFLKKMQLDSVKETGYNYPNWTLAGSLRLIIYLLDKKKHIKTVNGWKYRVNEYQINSLSSGFVDHTVVLLRFSSVDPEGKQCSWLYSPQTQSAACQPLLCKHTSIKVHKRNTVLRRGPSSTSKQTIPCAT